MIALAVVATGVAVTLLVGAAAGNLPALSWLRPVRGEDLLSRQRIRLAQAGVRIGPGVVWSGSVALGLVAFALLAALTGIPAVAVVPALAAASWPHAHLGRRRARRLRQLQEAWPDGIRELRAGITAGLSLNQALLSLVRHGPEPLREALCDYPTLVRIAGVGPALEVVREQVADPTSDRVIEVLILAHERGGRILPDILADLADGTTRDLRTREAIETAALEQRLNAGAVFVLPWMVLLVLTLREGPFREFYRSPAGLTVVAVGGLLSLIGLALVARLSRQPVEERVLGAAAPAVSRSGSGR